MDKLSRNTATPSANARDGDTRRRFTITLNLHLGKASFRLLATDLTEGYVNYNKSE